MRTIALQKQFIAKLADAVEARTKLGSADWYYSLLRPLCSRVDVWRTTYFHPLSGGIDAIVEWVKGTALMPYLNPLSETEREAFVAAYKDELAKAYTVMDFGHCSFAVPAALHRRDALEGRKCSVAHSRGVEDPLTPLSPQEERE